MRASVHRAGFSLIEILIAIVVLAITFLAVISVQGTAMTGYSANRDLVQSSEVARAIIEMAKLEAHQLRGDSSLGLADATQPLFDADTSPHNLGNDGILGSLSDAWQPVFTNPVDPRLVQNSATLLGGRYCVFVRGFPLNIDSNVNPTTTVSGADGFVLQVAVVYPSARGQLANCAEDIDENLLDPTDLDSLEMEGLRVSYFAATALRREFLS